MHIHGGGWIEGSNQQQSAEWRWYADRGWIVVSVGYSLSSDKRHLWNQVIGQLAAKYPDRFPSDSASAYTQAVPMRPIWL